MRNSELKLNADYAWRPPGVRGPARRVKVVGLQKRVRHGRLGPMVEFEDHSVRTVEPRTILAPWDEYEIIEGRTP